MARCQIRVELSGGDREIVAFLDALEQYVPERDARPARIELNGHHCVHANTDGVPKGADEESLDGGGPRRSADAQARAERALVTAELALRAVNAVEDELGRLVDVLLDADVSSPALVVGQPRLPHSTHLGTSATPGATRPVSLGRRRNASHCLF